MYALKDTTKIKTHKELGLSEDYWEGLWEVLRRLEAGWFKQVPVYNNSMQVNLGPNHFNMGLGWSKGKCGSIGCMMGWAQHFSKDVRISDDDFETKEHARLTCPPGFAYNSESYPPERCAPVLRCYLETGEVVW